jgi:hypothetical protein
MVMALSRVELVISEVLQGLVVADIQRCGLFPDESMGCCNCLIGAGGGRRRDLSSSRPASEHTVQGW